MLKQTNLVLAQKVINKVQISGKCSMVCLFFSDCTVFVFTFKVNADNLIVLNLFTAIIVVCYLLQLVFFVGRVKINNGNIENYN